MQPFVAKLRQDYSGPELIEKVRDTQMDALNRLIERALIIDEFKDKGYNIPEKFVDAQIDEFIATEFGGDRKTFLKTLQAQNMTQAQFRERERERAIVQAMLNEKTRREVVTSPYKIEKYYQDNVNDFKVDEQIKLRMIFIKKAAPEPVADTASVLETTAEDTQPAPTSDVAQVTAEVTNIPLPSLTATNLPAPAIVETNAPTQPHVDTHRALAEEILAKLDEGDSFESLAKVYSEGKEARAGGDWGWIGRDVLRKELNETAFALKPGEHSRIIETDDGYYILQVDDLKPAHIRTLAEVRNEIEKTLLQQQRTKMQDDWVKQLRAKAYIRMF